MTASPQEREPRKRVPLAWKHFFALHGLHAPLGRLAALARRVDLVSRYSAWRAAEGAVAFDDFPCATPHYDRRSQLYQYLLDARDLAGKRIHYLEFGVASGASLRWWLDHNLHADSRFVGFDVFTGLPEAWEDKPAGHFSRGGTPPPVDDSRCRFVPGLFQQTLRVFLAEAELPGPRVVHLDADLYSSTLYVLMHLEPLLEAGDLVLFDEFTSLDHEFRAWEDALAATGRRARLIAAVNNSHQVAFELL